MLKNRGQTICQRDISIVELIGDEILIIACDSAGGIGPKKNDKVKVPAEIIGSLTTRVALMEVISVGGEAISIINTLSVEYEPTGKEIIKGISKEVEKISLDSSIIINGSTEENIASSETGIGVTVIARAKKNKLKVATSQADDLIIAIGIPLVGNEVILKQSAIADLIDLQRLLKYKEVHEIIPVGSQGIAHEAGILARMSGLRLTFINETGLDLNKSAGPATTLLLSIQENSLEKIKAEINKPVNVIGRLHQNG